MPEIRPLRGWRFAGNHHDLSHLVAPPYDVIGDELEEALRARDPHNIVRLILPRDDADGPGSRYEIARAELERWAAKGALVRDDTDSFYPYRQSYRVAGDAPLARVGFLGRLRLEPFGKSVLAHERTLEGPREDRYRLLRATRANLSPVFVLFRDPDGEAARVLHEAMGAQPAGRARRTRDELDELWNLSDPDACARLQAVLEGQSIVFADGHHRYESALRYLESLRAEGVDPGDAAYCLAFFAPVRAEPGLSILPTHRIVHNIPGDRLLVLKRDAAEDFEVRRAGRWESERDVRQWEGEAAAKPGRVLAFAVPYDPWLYELTLRPEAVERALGRLEPPLRGLDVSVLHEALLKRYLMIGEAELSKQSSVRYSHDAVEALSGLKGDAQGVFLLRPTPIESVFDVAGAGLRMPQKSTFFYPKLATGFVVHRHN